LEEEEEEEEEEKEANVYGCTMSKQSDEVTAPPPGPTCLRASSSCSASWKRSSDSRTDAFSYLAKGLRASSAMACCSRSSASTLRFSACCAMPR